MTTLCAVRDCDDPAEALAGDIPLCNTHWKKYAFRIFMGKPGLGPPLKTKAER